MAVNPTSNARKMLAIDSKNPFANPCAHFSTPPSSLAISAKKSVIDSVNDCIAGASAATNWSVKPFAMLFNLVIASTVSSTPLAALLDIASPSILASPSISFNASLPPERVLTNAAPSESNSLNANLSLSDSFLTSEKASAKTTMRLSNGILFNS